MNSIFCLKETLLILNSRRFNKLILVLTMLFKNKNIFFECHLSLTIKLTWNTPVLRNFLIFSYYGGIRVFLTYLEEFIGSISVKKYSKLNIQEDKDKLCGKRAVILALPFIYI